MSGFKKHMDLPLWEGQVHYAARCRGALSISVSGEDTPLVVSGSWETSLRRLRRISSDVGKGANQSCEGVSMVGDRLVFSEVGESDSTESSIVMGCLPVSAMTKTRSCALWRAHPPLVVLRMAAWTSWHAALWRLMRRASSSGHPPVICVHEYGMWQSVH